MRRMRDGIDADAARREGMLAAGGELQAPAGPPEQHPDGEDDERHQHDQHRQHAVMRRRPGPSRGRPKGALTEAWLP